MLIAPVVAGVVAVGLAAFKLAVGLASGSVAVMASAVDSLLDCIVSVMNYFALKKSLAPANAKYNFGYGKLEALAAFLEGAFILGVGAFVGFISLSKIGQNAAIDTAAASFVMVISTAVTGILVWYLEGVAKKTNSMIVRADALHYKSDLLTNAGILIGVVAVWASGLLWLDAAIGVAMSIYIMYSALKLIAEGLHILLDGALSEAQMAAAIKVIEAQEEVQSYHFLKSRVSAGRCYFSVHLVFDETILLSVAHRVGDMVEEGIKEAIEGYEWAFEIHFDICDDSETESGQKR